MILKKLKDISYILFLLPLFFISENITAQCDVFIEPGSVQVTETSDAVMFTFDVINNSTSEWMGDEVLMYWSLNSSVNIMNIQYGDGSDTGHPAPLLPGESATFFTPWMAIPNLPEWFPEDPGPGGDLDDYWVGALDWPFWSANPNGFDGTWSQMNLRLGSCGLGDGAWVYDDNGDPYYGPFNENVCQDNNNDGFCDCDINVTGYDQDSHVVSIEVNSSYNCGCNNLTDNNYMDCYNAVQTLENTTIGHLVFGLNVQTLDEDWLGCLNNSFHEGWVFGSLNFNFNPLESGDIVSEEITIYNDCWDTMQDLAPNSLCLQMVVWQINYSQTAYAFNTYGGLPGWAETCGTCQYDTQEYPDVDIDNNLVVWCFNDNPPEPDVPGCTDPEANNYNPDANIDDESCEYDVLGCTNPIACNYNDEANVNDGSCITCDSPYEVGLEGCSNWEWYIGIFNCYGCTDPNADNYDSSAQYDDGSCEYSNSDLTPIEVNIETFCENDESYYNVYLTVQNIGGSASPEWCVLLGSNGETYCFSGGQEVLQPNGDTQQVLIGPIQGTWDEGELNTVTIVDAANENNLNNNLITFIMPEVLDCYTPSPDAVPSLLFTGYECIDGVSFNVAAIRVLNPDTGGYTADDTLVVYCIEVPELGLDSCLNGNINASAWIEPGGGQQIWNNIIIPNDITEITINVYNTEGETDVELLNNSITVLNIIQGNEVCEVLGCTDPEAINYNPEATNDDGSCQYPVVTDLSFDTLLYDTGCDEFGPYWSAQLYLTNEGTTPITEWCIQADILSTPEIDTICFNFTTIMPGETYIQQWPNVYDWGVLSLHVLHINGNSGVSWNQFGDDTDVADNMYVQIISDEPNCTIGCTDPSANNYNPNAVIDDGSCQYDITELTYVTAQCSVDCDLNGPYYYVITTWTNTGNTVITDFCAEWDVLGGPGDLQECFNGNLLPGDTADLQFGPFNSNGSPVAWAYLQVVNGVTLDPQIENYETLFCYQEAESECIYGCIDEEANNYNSDADLDDGSCEYDVFGCTDPEANNYNVSANVDDGSCTYDVLGCTDSTANNFNPLATVDDGSCTYDVYGCTDESANNYNPNANVDDGSCEYDVFGCTDETANNYNPLANIDDGSCTYDVFGCTDESANNYNPLANIDDGSCTYDVFGCTDSNALNYNPFANIDDGSCEYEIYGCTDPEALNYNELATVDNGTCVYLQPCENFNGSVYIPNSFTPDNDGINDIWKAFTVNDCWDKWDLKILNRWGNIIWSSDNPNDIWNGSFKDGDYYVQNGMYVYTLKGVTKNLNYIDKNGYIMVIR